MVWSQETIVRKNKSVFHDPKLLAISRWATQASARVSGRWIDLLWINKVSSVEKSNSGPRQAEFLWQFQ